MGRFVTAQKQTEDDPRAEAGFRAIVESIPAVTYREALDGDPERFYVSPQVEEIFGYSPEEWRWTPDFWIDHVHPDDRDRVLQADISSNETLGRFEADYRLRHADGRYVWVHESATFAPTADGLGFWQGFLLDITERREAEDALRDAEERFRDLLDRYRALVEQVPVAIYTQVIDEHDPDVSKTVFISPQAERMLGYSVEETLEDPLLWRRVLHPDDQERVAREDAVTNESGDRFEMEYRMITKDRRTIWIRDEATLIRDAEGNPLFWQGVMMDMTERKLAEAQLERALEVEREAARRLRSLDEMKNTFLQAVSHDLRTPLAAILGLAVTLERADLELAPDEARDLAQRIAGNARKLDRLVTDLLDLDRLARGIVEPKRYPTDVGVLVQRVVRDSELIPQGRLSIDAPSLVANVDASKVERIVENLLANSARHTPRGTRIWVRVERADGGLLITVEDDGPGIPDGLRDEIFQPFRQGPGAPEHSPGVGVGLALVARFAELMGGRAWVQDREGGGASFRVLLADASGPTGSPGPNATEPGRETRAPSA
jgi:PAS domain S-box-containing protein